MAIKWHNVIDVNPNLATASNGTQTMLLNLVNNVLVDDVVWGDVEFADTARAFLAAHIGTLSLNGGTGAVTQEAVGQLSRSYATPSKLENDLDMTSFGLQYRRLSRMLPTVMGLVP
jgi:Protein of unknown function (DUF4054)